MKHQNNHEQNYKIKKLEKINLPLSSLESSLCWFWILLRLGDNPEDCELLFVETICWLWPPLLKWGRVKKGAPNSMGLVMPNCRKGAHETRERGARWAAATAASWSAGCNPDGPDILLLKPWWPSTIIRLIFFFAYWLHRKNNWLYYSQAIWLINFII